VANPDATVRLFTINRSLAELIDATIRAVHGTTPPCNIHVSSVYDFLLACLGLFEPLAKYRLNEDDSKSGERINKSWSDFFQHQPVFQEKRVLRLIESLEKNGRFGAGGAMNYLRDEMIHIESGFTRSERHRYLTDKRSGRSIPLQPPQREYVLKILDEWDHWRATGDQCDIHGIGPIVAKHVADAGKVLHKRRQNRRLEPLTVECGL
jgi:hypothetical protein